MDYSSQHYRHALCDHDVNIDTENFTYVIKACCKTPTTESSYLHACRHLVFRWRPCKCMVTKNINLSLFPPISKLKSLVLSVSVSPNFLTNFDYLSHLLRTSNC